MDCPICRTDKSATGFGTKGDRIPDGLQCDQPVSVLASDS